MCPVSPSSPASPCLATLESRQLGSTLSLSPPLQIQTTDNKDKGNDNKVNNNRDKDNDNGDSDNKDKVPPLFLRPHTQTVPVWVSTKVINFLTNIFDTHPHTRPLENLPERKIRAIKAFPEILQEIHSGQI